MPESAQQPVRDTMTVDPSSAATPMPTGKWGPDEAVTARRADLTAPAQPVSKDVQVPGYEILGILGRGGMGVVYKARQRGLDRVVALKMVVAGAHAGPEQLARFRSEAAALAKLIHSNIVQVYEIGDCDGLPYFSLE